MCVLLMKRYLILSFFIIVGWGYSLAQSWSADNGNGTYTNLFSMMNARTRILLGLEKIFI